MAGTNIDENNGTLLNEIKNIKYQKNVYLLGEIEKIEYLYNSADINILCAKKGEGSQMFYVKQWPVELYAFHQNQGMHYK